MKFRHVAKINFADGNDPMYFIDGQKQEDVYSDTQLLHVLLGKSFEEMWIKSEDNMTCTEQAAVWNLSFFDTLDEIESFLSKNRSIMEDS